MARDAQITAAAIAIAGAITVAAAAGSFPAYACSGQGIGAATAVDPASTLTSRFAPSTTEAMPSRGETSSSGGESVGSAKLLSRHTPTVARHLSPLDARRPSGGVDHLDTF